MASAPAKNSVGFYGVTLEQFAGVRAASAEGIPLGDVLAQEDIQSDAWANAALAWREAVAESQALHVELIQKQRIAEETLGRKVEPLDDDPSAWVGLLSALATSDTPEELLKHLGITMTDVGRLGRVWRRRAEADDSIAKKLAELAPTAKPPEAVKVGPIELRPFPWTTVHATERAARRETVPTPTVPAKPTPDARVNLELASYQLSKPASDPSRSSASGSLTDALVLPKPSYWLLATPPLAASSVAASNAT